MSRVWTVREILSWTADFFKSKGIQTHRLDADILLAHALRVDRIHLYIDPERPVSQDERDRFRALVKRRGEREPVAYLTGRKEFWSLAFTVTPDTLIPRPDTELLVETVLERVQRDSPGCIMDLGTGSGCIAVAIGVSCSGARLLAVDYNSKTLDVARGNARHHGVLDRIQFVEYDCFNASEQSMAGFQAVCSQWGFEPGAIQVMVSNPPYIPGNSLGQLQPEISRFEPAAALNGGPDGLAAYPVIARQAQAFLAPGGWLVLECGDDQAGAVQDILVHEGFSSISVLNDATNRPRCVCAEKG